MTCKKASPKQGFALFAILVALASLTAVSCQKKASSSAIPKSVAVFVPGVVAGSAIYDDLQKGAKRAADEAGVRYTLFEAGRNQAEWQEKLTQLAADGSWDLIVTSNSSMPGFALETLKAVPGQKFLIVDAWLEGNDKIATLLYNQVEQGYLAGYLAGLVTSSGMTGANAEKRVGMVIAQRYPALDDAIIPGFRKGLEAAAPGAIIDERMVGNWYDAQKGMELAGAMYGSGVDVILPIAGGAGEGVLTSAQAAGKYVILFDSSAYAKAKGTIVGCTMLRQERAVYERVKAALAGSLTYGKAEVVSVKDGYVDFDDADPLYLESVPEAVRAKMQPTIESMRSGAFALESPTF